MKKLLSLFAIFALSSLMLGCASTGQGSQDDPFEPMNRAIFRFNDAVDAAILKPVAKGYKAIVPGFVRQSVTNVFGNARGVVSTLNAALQLKGEKFLQGFFRVSMNTIFGFGGLFDVATALNLPDPEEDFGQTLGYWGVKPGPYLVLPFLGPSNVRDTAGSVVDVYTFPITYIKDDKVEYSLFAVGAINVRSRLLDVENVAEASMLDRYIFFRDAYMQRRLNLVYDGNPPVAPEFDFDEDEL